jgi:hypothetical protein
MTTSTDLKYLFEPRSIAVVGASRDELKSGGMFVSSLLKDGYQGIIYPVNRKEPEIMSLRAYGTVLDIPGDVDLAVMAIPAQQRASRQWPIAPAKESGSLSSTALASVNWGVKAGRWSRRCCRQLAAAA